MPHGIPPEERIELDAAIVVVFQQLGNHLGFKDRAACRMKTQVLSRVTSQEATDVILSVDFCSLPSQEHEFSKLARLGVRPLDSLTMSDFGCD